MLLTPTMIAGALLIGLGFWLLLRDRLSHRRLDRLREGPGHDDVAEHQSLADVEITSREDAAAAPAQATVEPGMAPLSDLRATIERVASELSEDEGASGERSGVLEKNWIGLQPRIEVAIAAVNRVLIDSALNISPAGIPGWSFNNRGFGSFRRVLLAGDSVAWLRTELTADHRFVCAVRSHGDEKAALNSVESVSARALSDDRISRVIAAALQPITKYAVRNASKLMSEREVSLAFWEETEQLVQDALAGANAALQESQSSLVAQGPPQWDGSAKRHRLHIRVCLNKSDVGQLTLERPVESHFDCTVTPADEKLEQLARRQQVDVDASDFAPLAEAMVNCAWPSIEHAWNNRHRPGGRSGANG